MRHKRWVCDGCGREWVFATAEAGPEGHCPACGSEDITQVMVNGTMDYQTDVALSGLVEPRPPAIDPPLVLVETGSRQWPPAWAVKKEAL